jgi:hypothetical protein
MNEFSPELTRQVLHPAMHQKLLLRAAEVIAQGWTRGTAAQDADGQKVRSTSPQATRLVRRRRGGSRAVRLLTLDVYDLLGLEVDAYDTAPCPLEVLRALRRPFQRVLGRRDLAHWNDHVCPGPGAAEKLLRQAAARATGWEPSPARGHEVTA